MLWHQALLSFVQRYKYDTTVEQKEALKLLLRHQSHPKITPEVRREIVNSKSRGEDDQRQAAALTDTFAFNFGDSAMEVE